MWLLVWSCDYWSGHMTSGLVMWPLVWSCDYISEYRKMKANEPDCYLKMEQEDWWETELLHFLPGLLAFPFSPVAGPALLPALGLPLNLAVRRLGFCLQAPGEEPMRCSVQEESPGTMFSWQRGQRAFLLSAAAANRKREYRQCSQSVERIQIV